MGKTIYVDLNAKPEGNGSKEAPFLRIGEAAAIAKPGDTVLVAPGIYRESVHPVNAGTAGFDIFPDYEEWISHFMMDTEPDMGALAKYHFGHLPVWIDGNAYFNGANVYSKEKHNFVNSADKAFFELTPAEDGSFTLNTNIYDLMGDFAVEMIDSDVLGKAFEPEQRFENPDGSSIRFDTDYFGNKRTGKILPGPFAKPGQM